ncbi:tRNA (adenosine(37)-N6)-threonylcarbamoyltransferase complex dimerization subunit type 1 TsaB [Moraxella caviae]|uniref:tRNA threonylcarbamoyladenosine biosynthesis protein TsaB n=1 Tax=Moraxella caviae TaxID=34060 RepID=A0A1S9ZZ78_9GAMM|nr:tRNA (adenosine(37)-N6)-threonylcarbamoyltransferase complex dimerization subunit type 1 TsaB [Moraxella caviae]OOR88780.1 tRNA (adenosine(37)-N6)-threonylcarbamoyltransferase complex dimerization subunit type 1 TsaB [Moraxella caviae]STZ14872.1 UGMP family protein [Moraxella caviae]VEW13668.1 UGMP family protein [Moraxella caviae]
MLVAIETVFEQCSVAACQTELKPTPANQINPANPAPQVLAVATKAGKRGQTEDVLPMLDGVLAQANAPISDVSIWAFTRGPGAFSGIRIGTAVVQALSVANGVPCVGVSSLALLADTARVLHDLADGTRIAAVMDARQEQVYLGEFVIKDGQITANADGEACERLLDYQGVVNADVVVGDGANLVKFANENAQVLDVHPDAADLTRLALYQFAREGGVSAENALPVYLRNNAWKTLAEQGKKS